MGVHILVLTARRAARTVSVRVASSFFLVAQEDDADAHEYADEVDKQPHRVQREVSVA